MISTADRAMELVHSNSDTDDRIHLAISVWDLTDDYNRHAGVVIASFLDHCHGEKAAVHILYDETLNQKNIAGSASNKEKYAELCEKYGAVLSYHHVQLPEWVDEVDRLKIMSPGTLLRLYLPVLLPDVEKILYLDCDVVVNTDMRELWSMDLSNIPLAAAHDTGIGVCNILDEAYCRMLNTTPDRYFCAGVMLLNLQKIRMSGNFTDDALQYLRDNKNIVFLDQDVLNRFFGTAYYQLEEKYGVLMGCCKNPLDKLSGILHYTGRRKPWEAYYGRTDDPYWYYFLQTPWGKDADQVLHSMLPISNMVDFQNQLTLLCYNAKFSYPVLIKKIILSILSLTRKRMRDFKLYHL